MPPVRIARRRRELRRLTPPATVHVLCPLPGERIVLGHGTELAVPADEPSGPA